EGYPYRLAGQEISLGGRIVAVADSFDTMTAARSYSPAMSAEAARRELARCSGTQFDPAVVRAFLNVSLGRLRWAAGPLAWLAQLPFANGFARVGDLLVVGSRALAGTAAVTAGASVAGAGAPPAANGQTPADPAPPAPSPSPAPVGPPPAPVVPPTLPTPPIPAAPPPPPVVPPTPTPIAVADTATTPAGTAVTIPVLANDSGWTGTLDPTSVQVVSPPLHGSTTVAPTGT